MMNAYMTDTVVLKQSQGADKWGEPLEPVNVSMKARVEYKTRQVTSKTGQQVIATGIVIMKPLKIIKDVTGRGADGQGANTISYEDKLIVEGIEYSIARISQEKDFSVRALSVYII